MKTTLTQKNVHNKALVKRIDEHVQAVAMLIDLVSDIETVISLIEMMLEEEAENCKLEQLNVISDSRNNKLSDLKTGKFVIDLYYRHKNCFNITQLSFTIQK